MTQTATKPKGGITYSYGEAVDSLLLKTLLAGSKYLYPLASEVGISPAMAYNRLNRLVQERKVIKYLDSGHLSNHPYSQRWYFYVLPNHTLDGLRNPTWKQICAFFRCLFVGLFAREEDGK